MNRELALKIVLAVVGVLFVAMAYPMVLFIREMPALFKTNAAGSKATATNVVSEPAAAGISMRLQERIRDLEQTLREERRALAEAEQRYQQLEEKYNALLNRDAPAS